MNTTELVSEKAELEFARNKIISAMAQTMDLYGVTPSVGRLYGILYFNEKPMTLDEMREAMGMSKTSMSTGIKKLERNQMVKKVWLKGVRKDLYVAQRDFFESFIGFYCLMWKREIEVNMEAIKKAEPYYKKLIKSTNNKIKQEAQQDLKKLEKAKIYYKWLERLVADIENGQIFKYIPMGGE